MTTQDPMEPVALVHFENARRELELAASIDEVKAIQDRAEALLQYAKQSRLSLEPESLIGET